MKSDLILIIDDDVAFAETQKKTLALEGYSSVVANSGNDGIAAVKTDPDAFRLVLLDLRLPDMDGLSVLKKIKEIKPDLPTVIFTAFGTIQTAVDAIQMGAFDFLLKPFPRERLLSTIERSLESQSLIRENKLHQVYTQMQTGQGKHGMITFNQSLYELLGKRMITVEEAFGRSPDPDELRSMISDGQGSRKG